MKTRVVTVPKRSLALPEGFDHNRKVRLLYRGAGGALLPRLFARGLHEVKKLVPNLQLIGTDLIQPDELRRHMDTTIDQQGRSLSELPWSGFVNSDCPMPDGLMEIDDCPTKIDGVIIGLPTHLHFSAAADAVLNGVFALVEKPLGMIHELNALSGLGLMFPELLMAVDFFVEHAVMDFVDQLVQLGEIHSIDSFCVEPGEIANENRDWLMQPHLSGGGILIDCASHTFALQELALRELRLSLNRATIENVVFGRYSGAPGGQGLETAALVRMQVDGIGLNNYVGKAVGTRYYGLVVRGEKGEAEFFTGTETHGSYLKLSLSRNEPRLYVLEGEGLGYERIAMNLILAICDKPLFGLTSLRERWGICSSAIETIGRAYRWHANRNLPMLQYEPGQTLSGTEQLVPSVDEAAPVLADKGIWDK